MEETVLYPENLEQALCAAEIPKQEIPAIVDLLTYSLIAHL